MKPLKIIYFGTPDFSSQILESLIKNPKFNIVAVVTQTDKPLGRKKLLTATPVAKCAQHHNIPLFKPNKLDQSNLQHIKLLKADIFLVAAYGQIIPKTWLETPKIATLNIHFSLLPKYRGALCVSEALKNQDQQTGITLMKMDEQLDHGPIITQKKLTIDPNDNVASLTQKLTRLAISFSDTLHRLVRGPSKPQNHKKAIYTPKTSSRTRQSAFIPSLNTNNPAQLHALIRSLNPDPGAWTKINGQELKILETKLNNNKLEIIKIQLPGKNPISWHQFQTGHR